MFELNQNLIVKIQEVYDFDGNKIIMIIDNFYKNPDKIRDYAIKSKKYTKFDNPDLLAYSIGRRVCEDDLRLSYYMKDFFEQVCNHPKWHIKFDKNHHNYKWSGMRFIVNITNNSEIIKDGRKNIEHLDGPLNKWACVIYLNTQEECEGGTQFYSWNKKSIDSKLELSVEMKYNRAILYDANQVHGAILKDDMFKSCDRLVQVIFM